MVLWTVAALYGCVKNEPQGVRKEVRPISFNAIVGSNIIETKVPDETGYPNYPTDRPFGSAAFKVVETPALQLEEFIPESEVSYGTYMTVNGVGTWTTAKAYYWPDRNEISRLRFFSFSPWDKLADKTEVTATKGVEINRWDVDRNQNVDVMYAETDVVVEEANKTPVPTAFRHALSQIVKFEFDLSGLVKEKNTARQAAGDIVSFKIQEVTIEGLYTVGDFNSGIGVDENNSVDASWLNFTAAKNYTWYKGDAVEWDEFNNLTDITHILVLPQEFSENARITIKYIAEECTKSGTNKENSAEYTSHEAANPGVLRGYLKETHDGGKMNMGTKTAYKVTIQSNREIYWAPSIVEWTLQDQEIIK